MSQLAKSTIIVSVLSTVGIIFSFYTNILIAAKFGAGFEMDAYLAAISFPAYIVTILSGVIGITFIPVFAEYKANNPEKAWSVVNSVINLVGVLLLVIMIGIALFSYQVMKVSAPGFSDSMIDLSSTLLRWYVPVIFFMIMNEMFASIYYSHNQFFIPMLNKIISPSITIVYLILFSLSLSITSLVLATLTGSIVQFIILAYGIYRNPDFAYRFQPTFYDDGVKKVFLLMAPLLVGMLVYKIVPLFDRMILSSLPSGSISYLNYAGKLQSSMVQIIASSFSIPIYPVLAALSAKRNWLQLKETLSKIIKIIIFVSLPFAVFFAIGGESIIRILFQRGVFTHSDTVFVYHAFSLYMVSVPVVAIGGVVSQGLYVLQDTKTPVLVGFIETALYVGLCFLLLPYFNYLSIPIAYGLYFTFSVVTLGLIFRRKLGLGGGAGLFRSVTLNVLLSVCIGLFYYSSLPLYSGSDIIVIVICGICTITYFGLSILFKNKEAQTIWNKFYDLVYH